MLQIRKTIALSLLLAATRTPSQQISSLRPFHPGLSMPGTIRCWGSPQMAPLLSLWEEDFRRFHPEITFANNLKSTVSAIAGVYTGVADVGVLGRTIWPTETMAYQTVTGLSPIGIEVATGSFDEPKATFALGVFVHRTNPLTRLTTSQLEAILHPETGLCMSVSTRNRAKYVEKHPEFKVAAAPHRTKSQNNAPHFLPKQTNATPHESTAPGLKQRKQCPNCTAPLQPPTKPTHAPQ